MRDEPKSNLTSEELLRQEIRATSRKLGEHIALLRAALFRKAEEFYNPLGLRKAVSDRPLLLCLASFSVGLLLGARRRPTQVTDESPSVLAQPSWKSRLIGEILIPRIISPALWELIKTGAKVRQ
jgi:hypothetical protein